MPENSNLLPVTSEPRTCSPAEPEKRLRFKSKFCCSENLENRPGCLTVCQAIICPCMVVYKTEIHLKNELGHSRAVPCALLSCFGYISYCFPKLLPCAAFDLLYLSRFSSLATSITSSNWYISGYISGWCSVFSGFLGLCIFCSIPYNQRLRIRKKFEMQRDILIDTGDCCASMFCTPCVLCQNYAEIKPEKSTNSVVDTQPNTDF